MNIDEIDDINAMMEVADGIRREETAKPTGNFGTSTMFKGNIVIPKDAERMYAVNKGTGFWGPPMRLGASSEITILKLS